MVYIYVDVFRYDNRVQNSHFVVMNKNLCKLDTNFAVKMLRNIIIIGSTSGLVLFSKVFAGGISQPRLVGSLITAIIEFGQQTTGMGVCYIELTNVSITMVANEDAKVVCALFYDRDDGVLFGRLICSEILTAFTQEYSYDVTQFGKNLKDFYGFQKKIGSIVRFSSKSVILKLESHKAIKRVLLMNEREIIHTPSDDIDQLSILANLTAFIELCSGISELSYPFIYVDVLYHLLSVAGRINCVLQP